jgi:hypothetical protein
MLFDLQGWYRRKVIKRWREVSRRGLRLRRFRIDARCFVLHRWGIKMNRHQGLSPMVAFGSFGGLQGVLVSCDVEIIVRQALG